MRAVSHILLAFVVAFTGLTLPVISAAQPAAAAQPNGEVDSDVAITLAKTLDETTLYGKSASVTLTARNATGDDVYNLSFSDVLPKGASYGTSASGIAPTQTTLHDGSTLLVWSNVSDLLAGTTAPLQYTFTYEQLPTYKVGDQLGGEAYAYASTDARQLARFSTTPITQNNVVTGTDIAVTGYDSWASATAETELVPFRITKTEGSNEDELLRGVKDHKTAYTITIDNNEHYASTGFVVVDWLPAGLEFLGCDDVERSTVEEIAGQGASTGNFPAFPVTAPCEQPVSVTTVLDDADAPADGVWTRVEWSFPAGLGATESMSFSYAAAIPLRENVMPAAEPFDATFNLDNNTGALTTDEQSLVNHVELEGVYGGDLATYTAEDSETVVAEDVLIHKSVDVPGIEQGGTSTWTLDVRTSQYVTTTGEIVVTDRIPSGLDWAGSTVAPSEGPVEQSDGSLLVTWTLPALSTNGHAAIEYDTVAREEYRAGGTPVAANDSWSEDVSLKTTATTREDRGDAASVRSDDVLDASRAGQSAPDVEIDKKVATPNTTIGADCSGANSWVDGPAGPYVLGDTVCFRLAVTFPGGVDTLGTVVTDFLPDGFAFAGEGSLVYPDAADAAEVDSFTVDGPRLTWNLRDQDRGASFTVIVPTTVTADALTGADAQTGDRVTGNLMKLSYRNTAGARFQLRDQADITLSQPVLTLDKQVSLDGSTWVDGGTATAGAEYAYRIVVTNTGTVAAKDVRVSDALPAAATLVGGGANPLVSTFDLAAGASHTIDYSLRMPAELAPGQAVANTATLVRYDVPTNNGGSNRVTPGITDTVTLTATAAGITKTRTSGIVSNADGNIADEFAVGETIGYTIVATVPQGTVLRDGWTITDALPSGFTLTGAAMTVSSSATETVTATSPYGTGISVSAGTLTATRSGAIDATSAAQYVIVQLSGTAGDTSATIANRATLRFTESTGTGKTINSNQVSTYAVAPALSTTKTITAGLVDGRVVPGSELTYEITVRNGTGNRVSSAYDLRVVDTLPEGMTFSSAGKQPASVVDDVVTWNAGTLQPGGTWTTTVVVQVDAELHDSATFVNEVDVTGYGLPGTQQGKTYTAEASVSAQAATVRVTAKTADRETATIGEDVRYTLTATVPANIRTYDAAILDDLPAGLELVPDSLECTITGGGQADTVCDNSLTGAGTVFVDDGSSPMQIFLGDFSAAAVRTVTISYLARVLDLPGTVEGVNLVNEAWAVSNGSDVVTTPPTTRPTGFTIAQTPKLSETVTVIEPELEIVKTADTTRARPGDEIVWTITVTNNDPSSTAYDIDVSDSMPSNVVDVEVRSSSPSVTWTAADAVTIDQLAPGASATVTYAAFVAPDLGPGDEILGAEVVNTATIDSYWGVPSTARNDESREYGGEQDSAEIELDLAAFGDLVWLDLDGDGARTSGEPGIPGVGVRATQGGTEVGTATTDADGGYRIEHLNGAATVATVTSDLAALGLEPTRYTATDPARNGAGALSFALAQNGDRKDVDFGYRGSGSLAGRVWFDQDRNGQIGDDESGIGERTITLEWTGVGLLAGATHTFTVVAKADGTWSLPHAPAGEYVVTVAVPADGYDATTPNPLTVDLAANEDRTNVNTGFAGTGSIGDQVWYDRGTAGGAFEAGVDIPVKGAPVRVTWFGWDDELGGDDDTVVTVTTDAAGNYTVGSLLPGNYRVQVLGTVGAETVTHNRDDSTQSHVVVELDADEKVIDADFGFTGSFSLGDTVWWDRDGNGVQDTTPRTGEPGLEGVTVRVTAAGENGTFEDGDAVFERVTDENGRWLVEELPVGEYRVEIVAGVPAGFALTGSPQDSLTSAVTLSTAADLTQDFGFAAAGSIGDRVWFDQDGDGLPSDGEPGLAGVTVELVWGDYTLRTVTGADGAYRFTGLPDGDFTVSVDLDTLPAGLREATTTPGTITLDAADRDVDNVDFGFRGTGSIGDEVLLDRDGDGERASGDPAVAGATVTVRWAGVDGILDTADDGVFTDTTDAQGYSVEHLPAGDYRVEISTLPHGLVITADPDGAAAASVPTELTAGQDRSDLDWLLAGTRSVGDRIWLDQNADGVQDTGEPGLPGQVVELTHTATGGTWRTTTGADGAWTIGDLPEGDFTARIVGGIADRDDVEPTNLEAAAFTVAGADLTDVDLGFAGAGELGDTVVWQLGDAAAEADRPLAGVSVEIVWAGPDGDLGTNGDNLVIERTTDADGVYGAEGLPLGRYQVRVTGGVPSDLAAIADASGSATDATSTTTLTASAPTDLEQDFVYTGIGEAGQRVWLDLDRDGDQDADEPGIGGVTVTLVFDRGTPSQITFTTTTASDGTWSIDGLPAGDYELELSTLPGALETTRHPVPGADRSSTFALAAGDMQRLDQDFGFAGTLEVGDLVWFDHDEDGQQNLDADGEPTEPGLRGLDVTVVWSGADGLLGTTDDVTWVATTADDGTWSVDGLPAGPVRVSVESPGAGWKLVSSRDAAASCTAEATLVSSDDLGFDFGFAGTGSIGDDVWLDVDGSGGATRTAGDLPIKLAPVTVAWTGADGTVFSTTVRSSETDGSYEVGNLPPGDYVVSVGGAITSVPVTWNGGDAGVLDADDERLPRAELTLDAGEQRDDVDFSFNATTLLGDTVFWDVNGDGVQQDDEPGIEGVTVVVTNLGEDGVFNGGDGNRGDDVSNRVTTDAAGEWIITDRQPGRYRVWIDPATIPAGFATVSDAFPGETVVDGIVEFDFAGGQEERLDFGLAGPRSLGDRVWIDLNGDGVQDAGEPGLPDVDVELTWTWPGGATDSFVRTTGADGAYVFTGLPEGDVVVRVLGSTVDDGLAFGTDPDAPTADADGSADWTIGSIDVDTVDFGLVGTGSLGDTVWFDRDGDGEQQEGEPGIPGVAVTITWAGLDGDLATTVDNAVFERRTGADGTWSLDLLPAGSYRVELDGADLPQQRLVTHNVVGTEAIGVEQPLAADAQRDDLDWGVTGTRTIGDRVWLDLNGDGVQDAGEPGLPGQPLRVTWLGADGVEGGGDDIVFETTTGADGAWSLERMPDGAYTAQIVGGIVDHAAPTAAPTTFTVGADDRDDLDFGFVGGNAVGDLVWWDLDADARQDDGEPGLAGVGLEVEWAGPDGDLATTSDNAVIAVVTDADGAWGVAGLPDGAFRIRVVSGVFDGLEPTVDASGAVDGESTLELQGGETVDDQDFGYAGTGELGERVWLDLDGDGVRGTGEPGIPGVTVTVTWHGPDGALGGGDDRDWVVTTDAQGRWSVPLLPAGEFTVLISGVPAGLAPSGDPDGGDDLTSRVTLAAGGADLEQDFGLRGASTIGDLVWIDVDRDGVQDPGEPGVSGLPITVRLPGVDGLLNTLDDILIRTETDARGAWTATGLPAGELLASYDRSKLPKGLVPSSDLDGGSATMTRLALGEAQSRLDVDFAVAGTATICGVVFDDRDGDGVQDAGERGLGGVAVELVWQGPDGAVTIRLVSAADGSWCAEGVPGGRWTATYDPDTFPEGYRPTTLPTLAFDVEDGATVTADAGLSDRDLAETGAPVAPIALGAALLLALGAAFLLLRRRSGTGRRALR